jgi:type IV pilus assembly protein PilE
MSMRNRRGFTLIEMMVAVAVVAILGAIAYPSYQEHIKKVKRAEGKSALLKAAQLEERFYTSNGRYTSTTAEFTALMGGVNGSSVYSGENPAAGNYAVTIATSALSGVNNQAYVLTATPNATAATGGPFVDPDCGNFTLSNTGVRAFSGTATTRAKELCW